MRWIACLLAAAFAFSLAGCTGGSETITTPAPSDSPSASALQAKLAMLDPHGNVVLFVTNQSFEVDPADIAIEVDGQPLVDQYFNVGGQHNFERFVLRLALGRHVLTARSIKGKASLRKSFFVTGKHWIAVSYRYNTKAYGTPTPRQLDFRIQDRPMLFDWVVTCPVGGDQQAGSSSLDQLCAAVSRDHSDRSDRFAALVAFVALVTRTGDRHGANTGSGEPETGPTDQGANHRFCRFRQFCRVGRCVRSWVETPDGRPEAPFECDNS